MFVPVVNKTDGLMVSINLRVSQCQCEPSNLVTETFLYQRSNQLWTNEKEFFDLLQLKIPLTCL